MKQILRPTEADEEIKRCLQEQLSFSVIAGAGSGKTTSLVTGLRHLRDEHGKDLRQNGQRIVCITYTNRAVEVISSRLGFDDLYLISTLHGFLWHEINRFHSEIREALREEIIPNHLAKAEEKDTGRNTKTARNAREKVERLNKYLAELDNVPKFEYDDNAISNYSLGQLNHDDVISVAAHLIIRKPILRRIMGQKYPYIFVDEAQDTFDTVVEALNSICTNEGLPIIGYFGDPMQQIYEKRAGTFAGPEGSIEITKEENFRCSKSVIKLLNSFRKDVQQVAAGDNKDIEGSVQITLVQAEPPEGPRNRYTDEQVDRASVLFSQAIDNWGGNENTDVKKLFLVRQMIARRLGFYSLHHLFTGVYASSRAQEEYEKGEHFLLKPFLKTVCPLVASHSNGDHRSVIEILRQTSPAFNVDGINREKTLKDMMRISNTLTTTLTEMWPNATLKEILLFCREHDLCNFSDRLLGHLERTPREEEFATDSHTEEKSDWLCDEFFKMGTIELLQYCDFVNDNTPLSTQHGVKGEEYDDVLVVFDDVEAAWNLYSFTKTLTPGTSGDATEGQLDRSRKLAYVCFSRAKKNLRIVLFTLRPDVAKMELIDRGLFTVDQIDMVN